MATFLTTARMSPELAARIEASVRGKRNAPDEGSKRKPLYVAIARLALVALIVAVVATVVQMRRRDRREFEQARAALLQTVRAASGSLTPENAGAVARAEQWLERSAGAYEGDVIAAELRAPGGLAATLARPSIYVRGTVAQLGNPAGIAEAAAMSLKDPFVVCLVEPPGARTEKVLLAKVHDAFSNAAEQHSPTVRRLREAQVGLPYLQPPWGEKVASAKTPEELDVLRDEYAKAPVEGAKRALKAELLLFALDEPGEPGGPTELDGERPHQVRVGLVELGSSRVLLRMRKRVDPSWITAARRPLYASGLDSCALAVDVREAIGR